MARQQEKTCDTNFLFMLDTLTVYWISDSLCLAMLLSYSIFSGHRILLLFCFFCPFFVVSYCCLGSLWITMLFPLHMGCFSVIWAVSSLPSLASFRGAKTQGSHTRMWERDARTEQLKLLNEKSLVQQRQSKVTSVTYDVLHSCIRHVEVQHLYVTPLDKRLPHLV